MWHGLHGDCVKNIEIINSKSDREENNAQKKEIEIGEIGIVQKRALLSSFIGWMFDGFETSTLILVGSAAMLSLLPDPDPDQIRVAVGTALGGTLMGWAVGGTVGSIMADYIGRKKMLMISIVGYCAFTAFTALSQSVMMLIALRFLTGMFLGTEWSTGTALVAETWPASARAKALGFMQSGYGFGFFLAAGLWLLIQPYAGPEGWRLMFVIGVLPAIVVIYVRRQVPESKLWLEAVANGHAGVNGEGAAGKLTLVAMFEDKGAFATFARGSDNRFRDRFRLLRNHRIDWTIYRHHRGKAGLGGFRLGEHQRACLQWRLHSWLHDRWICRGCDWADALHVSILPWSNPVGRADVSRAANADGRIDLRFHPRCIYAWRILVDADLSAGVIPHPCPFDGCWRYLQRGAFGRLSVADPHRVLVLEPRRVPVDSARPHPALCDRNHRAHDASGDEGQGPSCVTTKSL